LKAARFKVLIKRFIKHKIWLPVMRAKYNILLTYNLNHLIAMKRKRGLNVVQINFELREILYDNDIDRYDGTTIFIMEPLFGWPHNQFDKAN